MLSTSKPLLANKAVLRPGSAAEPAEPTSVSKSAAKSGGSAVPRLLQQPIHHRSPISRQSPLPGPKSSQPRSVMRTATRSPEPEPDNPPKLPAPPRHSNLSERQEAVKETYFHAAPDTSLDSGPRTSDEAVSMDVNNADVTGEQDFILPAELTQMQPPRSEPAGSKGQPREESQTHRETTSAGKQPETQKLCEKGTETQTRETQGSGRRSRTSQMPWNKVNAPNKAPRPEDTSSKPVSTDPAPAPDQPRSHSKSREASAAAPTARDRQASGQEDAEIPATEVARATAAAVTMDLSSSDDELSDLGDAANKLADATMRLAEKNTHAAESLQPADKPKKAMRDGEISNTAANASARDTNDQDRRNKRPSPPDDEGDSNHQITRSTPARSEHRVDTQEEESEQVHPPKKTSAKRQRVDSPLPSQRGAISVARATATVARQAEKSVKKGEKGEKEAARLESRKGGSEQDTSADLPKRSSNKDDRDSAADAAMRKRRGRDSGIEVLPNHRATDADEEDEWLDEQSKLEQVNENDSDTDYDLPISKTAAAKKTATAASKAKAKPRARPSAKGKVVRETAAASKAKTATGKKDKKGEGSVEVPSSTPKAKRATRSTRSGDADVSMSSDAPAARASISNREREEDARQTRSTRSRKTPAPAPAAVTQSTSRPSVAREHEEQRVPAQDPALDVPLLVQDLTSKRTMVTNRTAQEAFQTDNDPVIDLPPPLPERSGHAKHSTALALPRTGTTTIPSVGIDDADPSVVVDAFDILLADDDSPPPRGTQAAELAQIAHTIVHPLQRDESLFDKYMNLPADEAGADPVEPANFDTDMADQAPAFLAAPLAPPAPESIAESVEYVRETDHGCAESADGEDTTAFNELAPPSSPGTNTFNSRADYVSPAIRSRKIRDSVGVLSSSPAAKSAYDALESLTRAQEEDDYDRDLSAGEERDVRGEVKQIAATVPGQRDSRASEQAEVSVVMSRGQTTETKRGAVQRPAGAVIAPAARNATPREPLGRNVPQQAPTAHSARTVRAPSVHAAPLKSIPASIAPPAKETYRETPAAMPASANLARAQREWLRLAPQRSGPSMWS